MTVRYGSTIRERVTFSPSQQLSLPEVKSENEYKVWVRE